MSTETTKRVHPLTYQLHISFTHTRTLIGKHLQTLINCIGFAIQICRINTVCVIPMSHEIGFWC